jgi:hypothetical protein
MKKYKYKIVLVCPVANWFRGNDLENVITKLTAWEETGISPPWVKLKSVADADFCKRIHNTLCKFDNYELRIEQPFINFYTNDTTHVEKLAAIDPERVKYVSLPNKNNPDLVSGAVIVKKLDYDYKVFMGRTRKNYNGFITWAETNAKVRLTPTAKKHLNRDSSWGGSYFYVKGDKTLTMVRVFLGSDIAKIDSVIKA